MNPTTQKPKLPTIQDLASLVRHVKRFIHDDCRADEYDEIPGIQLTVGWNPETGNWSYQTGDNSFTGGAYGFPIWAVTSVHRRSNSREVAKELRAELDQQTWS